MLQHLHIQNYALIRHLDIDFASGFTAITGETGAGKSIILGALGLVMGGRADTKTISDGEEKCVIEATFTGVGAKKDEVIVRRELNSNGRSRSFVNDEVVTQQELKTLAQQLIDIHSQHENLLLQDDMFQLQVVDAMAGNDAERTLYQEQYTQYKQTETALNELISTAQRVKKDEDYLRFQLEQLEEANLEEGEMEELEKEQYELENAESIQEDLGQSMQLLDDEENGAVDAIRQCARLLESISSELSERLESCHIELKDILGEIERKADQIQADPQRLEAVNERLDQLHTLLRKHQAENIAELITKRDALREQVGKVDSFDDEIERLSEQMEKEKKELLKRGSQLSKTRKAVCPTIEKEICEELGKLGVLHAQFKVEITPTNETTAEGLDFVQLLFAANKNQSLRAAAEVASGGEVARLMLCIKAMIADKQGLPTIIFDEVDTGVSGEIANKMGEIMRKMAKSMQIIAITHLPQIASQGSAHYKVYKEDTEEHTETHIRALNDEERVREIAGLLSGEKVTEAALENARELIKWRMEN